MVNFDQSALEDRDIVSGIVGIGLYKWIRRRGLERGGDEKAQWNVAFPSAQKVLVMPDPT